MRFKLWIILFFPLIVEAQIKFSAATADLMPANHFSGSVVGIADMNADGLDDIIRLENSRILSIAYQSAPGKAYRIRSLGQVATYEFWNVAVGDVNQDGLNDMVFAANENLGYVYYSQRQGDSIVYQKQALSGSEKAYAQAGNLVDINNDGWLDYFLCNDLGENKIWANSGGRLNGNPVPWIDFSTIPVSDKSGNYGSVWSDLDGDRDLDLYVAKCKASATDPKDPRRINTYYRNDGGGKFTESAAEAGIAVADQSWVAISGDSDNDGDQDLFIINHFAPCRLMVNDGKGKFTDATVASGINYLDIGVQAAWADLDNDGWLDLVITGSQHQIYRNKGQNKYELISAQTLGIYPIESMAIGDLNLDGRLDIYASYSQIFNQASSRPDAIWLNQTSPANHFLKVRVNGVRSNKSAIGCKIIVYSGGRHQIREIYSGASYGVHNSLTQHFGLGATALVDSVAILWPDGLRETIISPFIDRTLVITENQCFGFDPVLTPIPNKSVLCALTDSVTITSPFTGDYQWSNGGSSRSITIRSSGIYQLKVKTGMGCDLYSNAVSIDYRPINTYKIKLQDSIICMGSQTTLSIPTLNPIKWNTGDTVDALKVNVGGKYFATIHDVCSIVQSDTVTITSIAVPPLFVKNDTIPLTGKAQLTALGTSVFWFSEKLGGIPIATGNVYNTPALNKTTTYYAQSIITTAGKKFKGGIQDFSGSSKFHALNFSGRILFDVATDCVLRSVKVYTDSAASRAIDLLDPFGKIIASKLIRIEKGESRVVLNFNIPAGQGYALANNEETSIKIFGSKSPLLYRTEGAIPYPLVAGPLSINGTNAGPGNYYYYYDWEMGYPDLVCSGERLPVLAVIRTVGIKNDPNPILKIYPNPTRDIINLQWNPSGQSGNSIIELLDPFGRTLYKNQGSRKDLEISKIVNASGIYYLRVQSLNKWAVFKIYYHK